ncbi:MAG: 16S rRNA (cytosine(967)-C(5))-methyltransferase RsmB [Chthoniobacterales bacterium]
MTARGLAFAALREWRTGRRFADAILQERLRDSPLSGADRAFATELFYGVLRNLTLLDFWIGLLRSGALDVTSRDLLRLGLYQIFILRTPGHAAVFETVALASARRRSLSNGVLRTAQRRFAELEAAARAAPLGTRKSHPQFLIDRWSQTFGHEAAIAFCEWNNQPAPVYARINPLRISREQFLRDQPSSEPLPEIPAFVRLAQIPLEALTRGECYIQDPSTRLACELLDPQPSDDVLDACAAPGGKTAYLAALMQNRGTLIACDRDSTRVQILRENLEGLGVANAQTFQHDWSNGPAFSDHVPSTFDRILLDAPCTNTGVMRRRVDVRWRLRPADFVRMQSEQLRILRTLVLLLKVGGSLVYSTCSTESEENEQVVARALAEFPFLALAEQKTVLPFRDGFDGAFAARLIRRT